MATIAQPQTIARPAVSKSPSGLWSWLTTVDHKRIGILYGVTAFFFLLVGGLEAMIMRVQLSHPANAAVGPNTYNQLFTMHGTTMIFLAIMPLSSAFFNYIVPLQIGARDVAFPRLNAFSYWTFLAGGLILNLSWLANAAPDQGWYGYAPLTSELYSPDRNVDFWTLGLQVLGVASMAASFNFLITIINMRAPGMTLFRMPIFCWGTLITSVLIVLAFPAITVALILLSMDRFAGTHFYFPYTLNDAGQLIVTGGDPLLWQHLFWIFGHPEVYILILPAFAIVSEIIPVFSRKPLFGYAVMAYAIAAIAFLGFGVWVHHMFTTGLGPTPDAVFSATTMLIAIPTGVKIFNWVGTMWGGQLQFTTPMLFAVGLVSQFTIGGISGVMHASPPVDTQHNDSYFVVAHFHYVLFGGSIFGLLAAIYYWFPKFTGKMMDEGLGKLHFWLTFAGFNIAFFPMHFLGLEGMPRRYYTYGAGSGWGFWNLIVSAGAFLLGASFLILMWNIAKSLQRGKPAGDNPWDGSTLEWSIPSPPPVYNFREIPVIRHRDPLWEEKYGHAQGETHEEETRLEVGVAGKRVGEAHVTDEDPVAEAAQRMAAGDHHDIHLPNPSFYPLVASIGLFLAAFGLIFSYPRVPVGTADLPLMSLAGVLVLMIGIFGWSLEPAS
ncbi:MAG TPA: cytochrome c oxidase subunit I [Thermomicrobiales bacterium]|nr:cytochrome c oxidase subunit I [Thermomicrobiales bacterium]